MIKPSEWLEKRVGEPSFERRLLHPGQTLFAALTPRNDVGRDNLQAATKKAGDRYLGKLRRQENLDLSRRGIGRQDLEGENRF